MATSDKTIQTVVSVNLEQLASELAFALEHNQLIDFILELDAHAADLAFTQVLIMKLRQSIEEENIPVNEQIFELQEALRRTAMLVESSSDLIATKMWADGTDTEDVS